MVPNVFKLHITDQTVRRHPDRRRRARDVPQQRARCWVQVPEVRASPGADCGRVRAVQVHALSAEPSAQPSLAVGPWPCVEVNRALWSLHRASTSRGF